MEFINFEYLIQHKIASHTRLMHLRESEVVLLQKWCPDYPKNRTLFLLHLDQIKSNLHFEG